MTFISLFEHLATSMLKKSGITVNGMKPYDIQIYDKSIASDVILRGSLGLGDGYINKKWDVERLDLFFEKIISNQVSLIPNLVDFIFTIRNYLINTQIGQRAFQVGEQHYDLGNEMYEYMLGQSMGYSCGMFLNKSDDLTEAQYNKFDTLCKKLHLKRGMKVLEIGAGWGTFARHAVTKYGVEVIGLTISVEQKAYAEKRCKGLPVKILLLDYQNLDTKYTNYFDRVVSIEMIEAVGRKNFREYFSTVARALKNNGLFGLQSILGSGKADTFISTRIFPNGLVPSVKDIIVNSSDVLRIKHWESYGKDYDKTLIAWESNFRKNWKHIAKLKNVNGKPMYDEKFYRMWRYYLLCCAALFRVGKTDDAQIIMSKPNGLSELK
jgi:cyclopropane-fatty-acyl-phospholipid synthase